MTLTELFNAIAVAIRSKDGTTASIPATTFPERIMAISGSGGGNGGDLTATSATEMFEVPTASAIIENYYGFYSFNGVRLPQLPKVSGRPYVFIRKGETRYDLVFSASKYHYESDGRLRASGSVTNYWLTFEDLEAGSTWSLRDTTRYAWIVTEYGVLWSNYDIPNGSASATDIYFEGTAAYPIV